MAEKYLCDDNGSLKEREATVSSAGAGSAGKIVALGGDGKLDGTVLPNGLGADTLVIPASEGLAAGDYVNVHNSSGSKVRKADASNGRPADGFVLAAVLSGANATVYFDGENTALTGLTPGATYFLSATTAGGFTATSPTTAGQISQKVGRANSTTSIPFKPSDPITKA